MPSGGTPRTRAAVAVGLVLLVIVLVPPPTFGAAVHSRPATGAPAKSLPPAGFSFGARPALTTSRLSPVPTSGHPGGTINVMFVDSGLPGGVPWRVSFGGSPPVSYSGSFGFSESSGTTTSFHVYPARNYLPSPATGNVTPSDAGSTITIQFSLPAVYTATFTETGLPNGTSWGVLTHWGDAPGEGGVNSTGSTAVINLRNDSYAYSIHVPFGEHAGIVSNSGSLGIDGAPVQIEVPSGLGEYRVVFTETGLPVGSAWNASLNGTPTNSSGGQLFGYADNGTQPFTVFDVGLYVPTPRSSTVYVHGQNTSVAVDYTLPTFSILLTAIGLPIARTWEATLGNVTVQNSSTQLSFAEPNGTYTYTVAGLPGFETPNYTGTVHVSGSTVGVAVYWNVTLYTVRFAATGPVGPGFQIVVDNRTFPSSGPVDPIALANGTYNFSVVAPAGATVTPGNGTLVVDGSNLTESLHFVNVPPAKPFLASTEFLVLDLAAGVVAAAVLITLVVRRRRR